MSVQSICIISDDGPLLVRLIDWLNKQKTDERHPTTIFTCEGNVMDRFKEDT